MANKDEPKKEIPEESAVVSEEWDIAPKVVPELIIREHSGKFNPDIAKILVYGESGTGKTRFGSTFPKVIFADVDKGMSSVTAKVDAVDIDTFAQLEQLYAFLVAGGHGYSTVVLDTLNEMQRIAMQATVEDFPMIHRSYEDLPSMSDYGKMLHDFIELTIKFIKLPLRVVLLAQVNSRQFDTDVLQPQLIGKNSAREIARKMDIIGYMYKATADDKIVPFISFDSQEYVTKDRSFRLPTAMADPTWAQIAAYWK